MNFLSFFNGSLPLRGWLRVFWITSRLDIFGLRLFMIIRHVSCTSSGKKQLQRMLNQVSIGEFTLSSTTPAISSLDKFLYKSQPPSTSRKILIDENNITDLDRTVVSCQGSFEWLVMKFFQVQQILFSPSRPETLSLVIHSA